MKTLCLGGSFNPIHHGHLICARAVAEAAGYQKVVLVPSARPPHKPDHADLADASDRLHMCHLALQNKPASDTPNPDLSWEVSEVELARTGPSYTIDTVRDLKREGWPEVHWLIGADMLNYLPKWHESAALLREAVIIVMARPGVRLDWDALPEGWVTALKKNVVAAPQIDISSTQIRQRVKAGLDIDYLTPPAVVDYIARKKLYQ